MSNQTPKFSTTNQDGNKKSSFDYKLGELLLYLKITTYINNVCDVLCIDICYSEQNNLKKILAKNQVKGNRENPIISQ